jgi:soluble P-type ATPase
MIELAIPGGARLCLKYLLLDFNGTLALDGHLIEGVPDRLIALAEQLTIQVLTADTFGSARSALQGLPCEVVILSADRQLEGKRRQLAALGAQQTVAVGNGRNDELMLKQAALGIAVLQQEGAACSTVLAADIVCPSITAALDLLLHPLRLVATLRS